MRGNILLKGGFFKTFSVYFYKPFFDENKLMNLFRIGIDSSGMIKFKTYYLDSGARMWFILTDNKLKIVYIKE